MQEETQRYEKAIDFFKTALKADRPSGFNFLKRSVEIYALIGDNEKVHNVMEKLEKVSGKTGIDLSITKHFANRWLEGKAFESFCE